MASAGSSSNAKYAPYETNKPFPYCDDDSKYEKLAKIGQGTFGYVILFFFLLWPQLYRLNFNYRDL